MKSGDALAPPGIAWPLPRRLLIGSCAALTLFVAGAEIGRRAMLARGHESHPVAAAELPRPGSPYRIDWGTVQLPRSLPAGRSVHAVATFRNAGDADWLDARTAQPRNPTGRGAVRLSYRWWQADDDVLVSDYSRRFDLARPARPGETVKLPFELELPPEAGRYRLQVDLVHEFVTWFEPRGAQRLLVEVSVAPP